MYRNPDEYDSVAKIAIQIYEDYGLNQFPLDPFALCSKMGISVLPYSSLSGELLELSRKKSKDGYSFIQPNGKSLIIYNDDSTENNKFRIEFTILHELKHILDNDYIDDDLHDDLADYFAKFMKCPIPHLIVNNITEIFDIMGKFNVNSSTAEMVARNIKNRINRFGHGIFTYEVNLLKTILGDDFDIRNYTIIDKSNEGSDVN